MVALLFAIVSQARPTNLSVDRFEYTCPVRYTEINPCWGTPCSVCHYIIQIAILILYPNMATVHTLSV